MHGIVHVSQFDVLAFSAQQCHNSGQRCRTTVVPHSKQAMFLRDNLPPGPGGVNLSGPNVTIRVEKAWVGFPMRWGFSSKHLISTVETMST